MESKGYLIDLTKGPIQAAQLCGGDASPRHGGTEQRSQLSAEAWEPVGTEGGNSVEGGA